MTLRDTFTRVANFARRFASFRRPATDIPATAAFLIALNAKADATGSPLFAGIDRAEKARRRAAGKRQRAARKVSRRS